MTVSIQGDQQAFAPLGPAARVSTLPSWKTDSRTDSFLRGRPAFAHVVRLATEGNFRGEAAKIDEGARRSTRCQGGFPRAVSVYFIWVGPRHGGRLVVAGAGLRVLSFVVHPCSAFAQGASDAIGEVGVAAREVPAFVRVRDALCAGIKKGRLGACAEPPVFSGFDELVF